MEWISIQDNQPREFQQVLIYGTWRRSNNSNMDVGYMYQHTNDNWYWSISGTTGGSIGNSVTHWMPLPKPPVDTP